MNKKVKAPEYSGAFHYLRVLNISIFSEDRACVSLVLTVLFSTYLIRY